MVSRSSSLEAGKNCPICLDDIVVSQPTCEAKRERILDCSHIFHNGCIGDWLKQKHNCPVCRADVKVENSEKPQAEITPEVSYKLINTQLFPGMLSLLMLRQAMSEIRQVRQLDLHEKTCVIIGARKLNTPLIKTRMVFFLHPSEACRPFSKVVRHVTLQVR